ncbi:hypothetical protein AN3781.2 [Aspergillus nidulans FGSC A4]|uniref:Phosphate transporter n=1 Tax=Emericella nidulans (strain FGSC A4 / ATCC 38163 / CBS 112.46 / NRRL 194 / M139) TaxID=227321 RepID=Q5B6P9_EMENI|nr:hypothetical protein [Aspergillus nidulans FGSC A4]EAA59989.1 hypothetical protein AN3781.2 [Aspergillus nidulans FGSC A4]CBF75398.1 TPA: sodium/phosphate symporter, putative (AFU_orthologue; AFUA_7G06350) [Aspergillus nidulans FGSC A4]|eukprot:XP_661385.1 hypothetical protein AN3781.2 [Aspergillus nidulans FGSC A4]
MVLDQYTYIFAIGTIFAMLDAYNNGANDVANSWATSVSSRSISYRQAMVFGTIFEFLGAVTVGARTADTIKNGIIPPEAFEGNAGVQMLAFACALAAASSWVMWCTRHSTHVSSTYSLVSAIAGVGVATAGASSVQWGWNKGNGLGAIFAGLGMAPAISGCFGAIIFLLIKFVVHMRRNPVPWSVWTAPFFFLIAGTVCCLSIVYKGSPNLGLSKKPPGWVAGVTLGTGGAVCLLSAFFFVPFAHARVIKKDYTLKWWMFLYGPILFSRPAPADATSAELSSVPNYAVMQDDGLPPDSPETLVDEPLPPAAQSEKNPSASATEAQLDYKELVARGQERFHAKLRRGRGPLAWAMRTLHDNPIGSGEIYELHNIKILLKRIPAMITVGLLYGLHYDIHAAQSGIHGTPEGARMERVYAHATKYPNEVEHTYSFVQILTACTASFAQRRQATSGTPLGRGRFSTLPGPPARPITYHSPSRGCSMELGAAITVLVFSQYKLPVSTSMCITGATVGVGLCNGTLKAVNWQRVGLLGLGWIMTIPIAGTLAGCLMGLILNAPHFGS